MEMAMEMEEEESKSESESSSDDEESEEEEEEDEEEEQEEEEDSESMDAAVAEDEDEDSLEKPVVLDLDARVAAAAAAAAVEEDELERCTFSDLPDLNLGGGGSGPRSPRVGAHLPLPLEDSICARTRARLSLTDMSLDELEAFLQESDDEEDYFQNVDDEEEYRKFLAAVQENIDETTPPSHKIKTKEPACSPCNEDTEKSPNEIGNGNMNEDEDEDEDDDDFDVELEEALMSDDDDEREEFKRKRRGGSSKRAADATEKKDKKKKKRKIREPPPPLKERPLRPLLPTPMDSSKVGGDNPSAKRNQPFPGFTAHQIGQLHCLIHEHVQLLVQAFALCVLEPSRQPIAISTHKLLMDLVEQRDRVLSWKKTVIPAFCFCPPYIHPSVVEDASHFVPITSSFDCHQETTTSAPYVPSCSAELNIRGHSPTHVSLSSLGGKPSDLVQGDVSSCPAPCDSSATAFRPYGTQNATSIPQSAVSAKQNPIWRPIPSYQPSQSYNTGTTGISPNLSTSPHPSASSSVSDNANNVNLEPSLTHASPNDASMVNGSSTWTPITFGPVRSVLDVAPLAFVKHFLSETATVVQEYRQRHLESGAYHRECERVPLFPIRTIDQDSKKNQTKLQVEKPVMSSFNLQPPLKKSMAAALVESTKKQSLALVPKDIAVVIYRFFSYFNPALFPYKPPPAATANRLLFTDAEDELLAMGLMTYNTDWKAIRERYLPCKSTHQIFVRQKNRSSAKAPENSIKAVRRMKTSPLTPEEILCIREGLKIFKYDWNSVWQHCVSYRDPAVLPRQWRIALGIQKSYKHDSETREKRRIYAFERRNKKPTIDNRTAMDSSGRTVQGCNDGEANSGVDEDDDENEVQLHEAFLTDPNPLSTQNLSGCGMPSLPVNRDHSNQPSCSQHHLVSKTVNDSPFSSGINCAMSKAPSAGLGASVMQIHCGMQATGSVTKQQPSSPVNFQPVHFHKKNGSQTVRLAPGLPCLDLPPSVRVISRSSFSGIGHFPPNQHVNTLSTRSQTEVDISGTKRKCETSGSLSKKILASMKQPSINNQIEGATRKIIADNSSESLSQIDATRPLSQASDDKEFQMHPLLMQRSFESVVCSSASPVKGPPYGNVNSDVSAAPTALNSQPSPFQCFLGGVDIYNIRTKEVAYRPIPIRPPMTMGTATVELHPFLQATLIPPSISKEETANGTHLQMRTSCVSLHSSESNLQAIQYVDSSLDQSQLEEQRSVPHEHQQNLNSCNNGDNGDTSVDDIAALTQNEAKQNNAKGVKDKKSGKSGLKTEQLRGSSSLKPKNASKASETTHEKSMKSAKRSKQERCSSARKGPLARNAGKLKKSSGTKKNLPESVGEEATSIVMEREELSDTDNEAEGGVQFEYEEMADSDCDASDGERSEKVKDIEFEEEEINSDDTDSNGELEQSGFPQSDIQSQPMPDGGQAGVETRWKNAIVLPTKHTTVLNMEKGPLRTGARRGRSAVMKSGSGRSSRKKNEKFLDYEASVEKSTQPASGVAEFVRNENASIDPKEDIPTALSFGSQSEPIIVAETNSLSAVTRVMPGGSEKEISISETNELAHIYPVANGVSIEHVPKDIPT